MNTKVKTIDINVNEWFDKINGNSYFSAIITLNFGMNDSLSIQIPFTYGYGDYSRQYSIEKLNELGYLPSPKYWELDEAIIVRYNKQQNCKKRDLIK